LVEFAIFFSLLMLLVAAATDETGLLNDHLNLVYAARQGARTAAVLGNNDEADCAAIGAVQAALSNAPSLTVTRIVIYQASATGVPVSNAVRNVYSGTSRCQVVSGVATVVPAALSIGWAPSARNTTPFIEDSVGVQIDFNYTFQFQLLGSGTLSGTERAVMPLGVAGLQPGSNGGNGNGNGK
jgi:Flp pilus assembly protein TadG